MTSTPAFARFQRVLDTFDWVVARLVMITMGVLTCVVVLQVFFRYVLNDSLQWGWDIPRLCFIWVLMLSIPLGLRHNAHVGIDILVSRFSPVAQRAVLRFNAVFMLLLSAIAAWYGLQLARGTWDQMMPGIELSVGLFYVGLVIGQVHTCLHVVRILITGDVMREPLVET